jgi:teichuronic acid biosynthesis glycosyltransferase TuaC
MRSEAERVTDAVWITPVYPWEEEPVGGIFHQTQVQALARLGVAVTVLSPTPWAPWPLSSLRPTWRLYARAPRVGKDEGVTVARPRYPNVPGQPTWARADSLIARAAWRARRQWTGAQLIHGHAVVEGLAAWRVARRARLPFILTFHGSDMNTWPDQHPERLPDLRTALREAAAVITVSASLAERVRVVTGVEALHMPIGSDHRSLAASALPRREARRILGLPDDRVIALFVGHLLRAKGVRELADAVVDLGDPFLGVFVGDGPEAGYGEPGSGRLLYTGERPHDEVVHYMSAADVLVLPSYNEGLPTVIVEAGSLGLPVIGSNVGGIPELLGDDRGTILSDSSAQGVAIALRGFLADRDEAEAAARRLHQHVVEGYDVDANAAALLEWYLRVTARAAAS